MTFVYMIYASTVKKNSNVFFPARKTIIMSLDFQDFFLCIVICFFLPARNRLGPKRTSFTLKQRVFMLLLLGVISFFTLIIIMAKLGRASADDDPNLNPMLNPNIRVGNE